MPASPAIVSGWLCFGAEDGRLIALDLNTGKKSWMFRADDMIRSTPAMAAGVICFGSDDGYVYALEIAPAAVGRDR